MSLPAMADFQSGLVAGFCQSASEEPELLRDKMLDIASQLIDVSSRLQVDRSLGDHSDIRVVDADGAGETSLVSLPVDGDVMVGIALIVKPADLAFGSIVAGLDVAFTIDIGRQKAELIIAKHLPDVETTGIEVSPHVVTGLIEAQFGVA